MKKKGFKGTKCEKRVLSKCSGICRTYSSIQSAYADVLQADKQVKSFQCNVVLDGLQEGEYTTDFVCNMMNGELMVRECVERRHLTKPLTVKQLDWSLDYWTRRGVVDWGVVIDAEK